MASVRIVTDSSCDLPEDVVQELGIKIVPLTIRFGDKEYTDRVDFTPTEFWDMCKASDTLPETAAPAPGAFEAAFRECQTEGADGVVCINISSALSATMQSAKTAATSIADDFDVRVIDSRSVTMGLGAMVMSCARLAASGADLAAVEAEARKAAELTEAYALIGSLDNLKKGGRIGGAQAFVGSLLSIKPIIRIVEEVHEESKQRTRTKAIAYLVDKLKNAGPIENLSVMHAACDDVEAFIAQLRPFYDGEIITGQIGPVVGSHSGVGTMGMTYQLAK